MISIPIVSLDHLIHYHPVINTFSSSLYTSILKIPVSLLHISSVVKGYVYDLEIILLFVLSEIWYIFNKSE